MIRSIDNILYSRYKRELHDNNKEPSFSGKEKVFIYKKNILTLDGKKFSGEVSRDLSDGTELRMKYLKGILQNAQKTVKRFIDVVKFNPKGETTAEKVEIPPKVIYNKAYKYDDNGELVGVTKNNIGIFHKRYKFNGLSQTEPIIKELNHGEINVYYDIKNRPVYYNIVNKYLSGMYIYDGTQTIERRLGINPDDLQNAIIDTLKGQRPAPQNGTMFRLTKEIIRDSENLLDAMKITNCDSQGRPVETVVRNVLGELRYIMTYEYNKRGNIYKRVTHNNKYKFEEYLNKDKIAVATKLINADGAIIEETKRDLYRNTKIMYRETTKHNYLKEHIVLETEQLFNRDINTYTTKITMPNNTSYKRVTKVDNLRNGIIEDRFYDDADKEINPTIYLNIEQMVSKLNIL